MYIGTYTRIGQKMGILRRFTTMRKINVFNAMRFVRCAIDEMLIVTSYTRDIDRLYTSFFSTK